MKYSVIQSFCLFCLFVLFYGCKEEVIGQWPVDNVPPGKISNATVKRSIPGGAVLTYTLPDDDDLLFIKAAYFRNDSTVSETISSIYNDTLTIAGFGDVSTREIKLYAVDRSRNESEPVTISVTPLEPPVHTIGSTLNLLTDFGGFTANWSNPSREEIGIVIEQKNAVGEYIPLETLYSEMSDGVGAIRGLDTVTYELKTYVKDKWGNKSAPKNFTLTPYYETQLDKTKFVTVEFPGDLPGYNNNYGVWRLYDGVKSVDNAFGSAENTAKTCITIDLGVEAVLSRFVVYQRIGSNYIWAYNVGNLKDFELWGCSELILEEENWQDNWIKLMECHSVNPSDLPIGSLSNEDRERAANGEEFIFPLGIPKIRYFRVKLNKCWDGSSTVWFHCAEMTWFGDPR
jgi:hypothetical protein